MASAALRIGPADQGRKMTLDEFREADEEPGYLYELARGELDVTEVPGDDHGQVVDNIHEVFSGYRTQHPGRILRFAHGSDIRLIIPELESDRHPDLAVVFRDAARNARGRQIPARVVEVVSPGKRAQKRDYEDKSEEYLTLGIQEYWIVDPAIRQVVSLSLRGEGMSADWDSREFRNDDVVVSRLLPRFEARVSDFWRDLDGESGGGNGE